MYIFGQRIMVNASATQRPTYNEHRARAPSHVMESSIFTGRGEHFLIGFHFANKMWMMDWNLDYANNAPCAMKTKPTSSGCSKKTWNSRPNSCPTQNEFLSAMCDLQKGTQGSRIDGVATHCSIRLKWLRNANSNVVNVLMCSCLCAFLEKREQNRCILRAKSE